MALIQCSFFSEVLSLSTTMTVILPQETHNQIGMKGTVKKDRHPTLYLLHGFSDDDSIWLRRTSIERYVAELGLAVVMPQVHHSFYTNMEYGNDYWTFLTEELPALARSFFPLSERREDNFVAGLSMGGYGAFKWALAKPDQIAAAASLSGVLDIASRKETADDHIGRAFRFVFGEKQISNTEHDLFWLLKKLQQSNQPRPKLYQACGTEDHLYKDNVKFTEICKNTDLDLTVDYSSGTHEWGYWDEKIQSVLKWLPINN
ncbi:alpha/beta hydrolase [Bacillus kwashiorkori]|uniref:alpha/beta hydrolase n=1 Tax=Bacillus kwashiorkori TaxID=1522318 RepID=UPI000781BBCE|nr:alpha/beta hydrolase family protein [Bacillus kwashiorkori]